MKPKDLSQYNFTASTGDQISGVTVVGNDFKLGDVKIYIYIFFGRYEGQERSIK